MGKQQKNNGNGSLTNKQRSKIKPSHELSEDEKNHLRRSGRYIAPAKPTFLQELKTLLASVPNSVKNAISFKTLGQAVNASVLIGAITFIAGEQGRRDAQVYQAWQVINSAHNQPGSGGRIQALEFLNSEPRRIPWFWLHWERESLSGLEAPKAYLVPSHTGKKGGIQLSKAELRRANLQGADLYEANLQRAHLIKANLKGADLYEANLQGAELISANLQGAELRRANLQGAELDIANLQGADLRSANNLQGAHLFEANLKGADLYKANLQGADLRSANLQGAHLESANLQGGHLRSANLQGAHLESANLQGAHLESANLQKAEYTDNNTSFKTCNIYSNNYPCPTIFPKGFNPKAAGMELLK